MSVLRGVIFGACIATAVLPVFAEESNYLRLNREQNWQTTSNERLERIINNPARYNPEEFVAALHEYSKRRGGFTGAKNSLEALVNAYIAKNPGFMSRSTEDVFIQVGKSRGVPSLFAAVSEDERIAADPYDEPFLDGEAAYDEGYINSVLERLDLSEKTGGGITGEGVNYAVYRVNEYITATVSSGTNDGRYVVFKVSAVEAMNEMITMLEESFSERISYIKGGYLAFYWDTENAFITDETIDYSGTLTLYGSQMFVEEVLPKNKIITQRQWCTGAFYEACALKLGEGWGFIASWDVEE